MFYQDYLEKQEPGTTKRVDPKLNAKNEYFMVQPEVEAQTLELATLADNDDEEETKYLPKQFQRIAAVPDDNKMGLKVGDEVGIVGGATPLSDVKIDGILYVVYRLTSIYGILEK